MATCLCTPFRARSIQVVLRLGLDLTPDSPEIYGQPTAETPTHHADFTSFETETN